MGNGEITRTTVMLSQSPLDMGSTSTCGLWGYSSKGRTFSRDGQNGAFGESSALAKQKRGKGCQCYHRHHGKNITEQRASIKVEGVEGLNRLEVASLVL